MIQHHNIQLNVTAPKLNQPIVPFINIFGQLWFGKLKPEIFCKQFVHRRDQTVQTLKNLSEVSKSQPNTLANTNLQLDFLHNNLHSKKWNFPCLVNDVNQERVWATGNQRLLVTGLQQSSPWKYLDVLMLCNSCPDDYLQNPMEITCDSQLETMLNFSGPVTLDVELSQTQGQPNLRLSYLGPPTEQEPVENTKLKQFASWQQRYGSKPVLEIYTNWPEMITDKNSAWDIKIVGNSEQIQQGIFRPGHLENNLRKDYSRGVLPTVGHHRLLVVAPRPIDVGELLFWVNLEKNVFIDCAWQFLLHRPDTMFENTFIGVSDLTL